MHKARGGLAIAGVALFVLTACAGKEPQLMNLRSTTNGPDEFAIVPPKPLATPPDLTQLPDPTPGGANLTDQNPFGDAVLALGGTVPGAAAGIPSADAGLVRYAGRQGTALDIRAALAAEDLAFRKKNPGRLLERAFGLTTYFKAYRRSWLDEAAELAKWRAAGAATPSAPPQAE